MSDTYPSRLAEKIMVRLPNGMRDRLSDLARSNKRSVNAEVVAALEAWTERNTRSLNVDIAPGDHFMILGKAVAEAMMEDERMRALLKDTFIMVGPSNNPEK